MSFTSSPSLVKMQMWNQHNCETDANKKTSMIGAYNCHGSTCFSSCTWHAQCCSRVTTIANSPLQKVIGEAIYTAWALGWTRTDASSEKARDALFQTLPQLSMVQWWMWVGNYTFMPLACQWGVESYTIALVANCNGFAFAFLPMYTHTHHYSYSYLSVVCLVASTHI